LGHRTESQKQTRNSKPPQRLRHPSEEVKVRASTQISPDPKDDAFYLCAEFGKEDFLITLNPRDFPQARLKTRVLLPGGFKT